MRSIKSMQVVEYLIACSKRKVIGVPKKSIRSQILYASLELKSIDGATITKKKYQKVLHQRSNEENSFGDNRSL